VRELKSCVVEVLLGAEELNNQECLGGSSAKITCDDNGVLF